MFKRIHYNAPVTLTFTFISLVVLLISYLTNGNSTFLLFSVYRSPLSDPFSYIRIVGHVAGHADFQHFFGNFSIILLIGPLLEEKYGSKYLAGSVIMTALITGFLEILLFPNGLLLGASGIVFMMILMSSFTNFKKGLVPLSLIIVACLYLGQEIFNGIFVEDNISQLTHIIGGLSGAALGYFFYTKKETSI